MCPNDIDDDDDDDDDDASSLHSPAPAGFHELDPESCVTDQPNHNVPICGKSNQCTYEELLGRKLELVCLQRDQSPSLVWELTCCYPHVPQEQLCFSCYNSGVSPSDRQVGVKPPRPSCSRLHGYTATRLQRKHTTTTCVCLACGSGLQTPPDTTSSGNRRGADSQPVAIETQLYVWWGGGGGSVRWRIAAARL
ncbi:unnamed protein product [Pleuronectes platessa]|uniref:Uncharacterized protein n=1 Tax=Pleuronectes platessa TaxID=8262 RepID=A0A9N7V2Z9_PLEPL|nr:unnamed protein product [Pleuronectes platessa]